MSTRLKSDEALGVPTQQMLIKAGVWACCLNCHHFVHISRVDGPIRPHCRKWGSEPPTDVIVVGCDGWEEI